MPDRYDAWLLDLDGTVYRGPEPVPNAAEAIAGARKAGLAIRFVTNNASRPPQVVADQLTDMGVAAAASELNTSAQAAAHVLAEQLPAGDRVLVVGAQALADEISRVGLKPVYDNEKSVAAVVQGLSKTLGWAELAEACVALNAGARWVACNVDPTLPTERGFLPGNGSLVAALRTATGREPQVAGKPAAPLMNDSVADAQARRPLVIGDRLDTDIAGAQTIGADSVLVFTGVSRLDDVLALPLAQRPTYLADDMSALAEPSLTATGDWQLTVTEGEVHVSGNGSAIELARALAGVDVVDPVVSAGNSSVDEVLRELNLPR